MDVIRTVTKTTETALQKKRTGIRYGSVVTLDVKNAFNNVSRAAIECAIHLLGALESYFQNRVLIFDTEERERSYNIIAGISQGCILGPILLNVAY